MIDDATTLANYLKIYEEINKRNVEYAFLNIELPALLLMGGHDTISYMSSLDEKYLSENKVTTVKEIKEGSHFMLIEYPKRIAEEIHNHIDAVEISPSERSVTVRN
jgi:pimeloyl-ACP methyl ester carboxylesterase